MTHYWYCELCSHEWDLDAHDTPVMCPWCGSDEIDYETDQDGLNYISPALDEGQEGGWAP